MYFDLKKHNTSGITYKDDGQIPSSKLENGKIVNTNSIPFTKPYRLQIRASKVSGGKRNVAKKTLTFPKETTLLDALKEAQKTYDQMMNDLENGVFMKKQDQEVITEESPFGIVWSKYLEYKVLDFQSKNKPPFNTKQPQQFYEKWLTILHDKPLNKITKEDIVKIKAKMKNKKGEPLAERTKRWVNQYINPVYTYANENHNLTLKSPASMKGLEALRNAREIDLSIEEITQLFQTIHQYPLSPFRELFMWLMHGRRIGEVMLLEWKDINFERNTYTIRSENNKARIDMSYMLSPRLKATLEVLAGIHDIGKMKGYVFKAVNNPDMPLNHGTIRNHWDKLNSPIVMHDLRKCIVDYLKNIHEVSDEICGYILGHTQNKSITQRYGKHGPQMLSDKLNLMLDEIFADEFSKNVVPDSDAKLLALQKLFPEKSLEQLKAFLSA